VGPDHDQPGRSPLPPRVDPRAGRGRDIAQGRGRRRPLVAAVRTVCGLLSLVLLVGSGWGWDLAREAQASVRRTNAIPTNGNSDVNGNKHAGSEMNLLLVGMDSRAGLTAQQQDELDTGDDEGLLNTDTMILVHVPADGSAASFVSLPRDTYVPIPGNGKGKLNSAYGDGYNTASGSDADKDAAGSRLLIQTISQLTGLQIDHYAEVNLLGFFNLSNIVGGVQVNLCYAVADPDYTGARFPAGVQTISGAEALKFVRERHGYRVDDPTKDALPRSDIDREIRQQVYIAGLLRNVLSSKLLLNPAKQQQIVKQVGSSITVDQGLDLFDLASQMQGVQPGNITFQSIPGLAPVTIPGAGDVVQPPAPQAVRSFFADLTAKGAASPAPAAPTSSAPAPATVAPGQVTVSVLNGSSKPGAAGTAATALTRAGFRASSGGNATHAPATTIRHRTGDDAAAATLAAQVPGATIVVDDTLAAGHLTLTLCTDFTGVGQPVTAAPASTSSSPPTTAPGAYENKERTAADTSCIN
jgi:LCP family protein required for cell wall assembly